MDNGERERRSQQLAREADQVRYQSRVSRLTLLWSLRAKRCHHAPRFVNENPHAGCIKQVGFWAELNGAVRRQVGNAVSQGDDSTRIPSQSSRTGVCILRTRGLDRTRDD